MKKRRINDENHGLFSGANGNRILGKGLPSLKPDPSFPLPSLCCPQELHVRI